MDMDMLLDLETQRRVRAAILSEVARPETSVEGRSEAVQTEAQGPGGDETIPVVR